MAMNYRYQLRGRKTADSATFIPTAAISGLAQAPDEDRRAARSDTEADTRRSYSEIVASRPLTPLLPGEGSVTPDVVENGVAGEKVIPVIGQEVQIELGTEGTPQLSDVPSKQKTHTRVDVPDGQILTDEVDNGWKKITRKSLKTRGIPTSIMDRYGSARNYFSDPTINRAVHNLTSEQRERIFGQTHRPNRYEGLENESDSGNDNDAGPPADVEDGPPIPKGEVKDKGKGADPRNWGGIVLNEPEMDLDQQRTALKFFKESRGKLTKGKSDPRKVRYTTPNTDITRSETVERTRKSHKAKKLAAEVRPASQLPANSYLGAVFKQAKSAACKRKCKHRGEPSSDSEQTESRSAGSSTQNGSDTDGPSDPSSSDESSSDTDSSDTSSTSHRHRSRGHHGRRKHRRRSRQRTKAIPPRGYNGKENPRAFHRFVKESINYLEDARVPKKRHAYTLSTYMTGRAYDYYTQKVAQTEEKWSLDDLFQGLFNYCFPANYRIKMHAKLEKLVQSHDQSVIQYVYELEELFNLIGNISEGDRVIKLWNGLRYEYQSALWRDRLHPEVSSWDDVVAQAETIEISRNISTQHKQYDRREGTTKTHPSSSKRERKDRPQRSKYKSFN